MGAALDGAIGRPGGRELAVPCAAVTLRSRRAFSIFLLAWALGLAACGGGDGSGDSSADPQQVLDDTFSPKADSVQSGAFDLSLKIEAEGGDDPGTFEVKLGGPFDSSGDGVPRFDLTGEIKANTSQKDLDFAGGLTSTGDSAFINYQDTDYEVPAELFDQFATSIAQLQDQSQSQQDTNLLSTLGIDPSNWLTNLQNEGTEDVEGTETVHISGQADVPKFIADLQTIAKQAGQATAQVNPQQLSALADIVKSADFDIYSGTDDDLLRKIDASLELQPPAGTPGALNVLHVDFSLTLSGLGGDQEISAPEGAEPLATLLSQFGIDASQLGGALQGGLGGGAPPAGGSPSGPSGGSTGDYIKCLQTATGAAEIQACADLFQ